eukprot:jgi/Chrzof1/11564/Cz06g00120.t1
MDPSIPARRNENYVNTIDAAGAGAPDHPDSELQHALEHQRLVNGTSSSSYVQQSQSNAIPGERTGHSPESDTNPWLSAPAGADVEHFNLTKANQYLINHSRGVTTVLVSLARVLERVDEQLLPAVYLYVGCAFGASPQQLGTITFCRAVVQALASPFGGMMGEK